MNKNKLKRNAEEKGTINTFYKKCEGEHFLLTMALCHAFINNRCQRHHKSITKFNNFPYFFQQIEEGKKKLLNLFNVVSHQ